LHKSATNNICSTYIRAKKGIPCHVFLLSKPPINNPKAWDTARKTGWKYLRLLISQCHHKLIVLVKAQESLRQKIEDRIEKTLYDTLTQVVAQRCKHVKADVERRHQKKLANPSNRKEEAIKKKWVVNISNRELDKNEISLLRKGLNFAITPSSVPTKEILASVESAIDGLPKPRQSIIRSEICSTLKQAHPAQNPSRAKVASLSRTLKNLQTS
jgi:hypothetical protein